MSKYWIQKEYYWYFAAESHGWLKMPPGRYPCSLIHSIELNGLNDYVFIFDEYGELLHAFSKPEARTIYLRIVSRIQAKFHILDKVGLTTFKRMGTSWFTLARMFDRMETGYPQEVEEKSFEIFGECFLKAAQRRKRIAKKEAKQCGTACP